MFWNNENVTRLFFFILAKLCCHIQLGCDNIKNTSLFEWINCYQKCNLRGVLWKEGICGAVECWVTSYIIDVPLVSVDFFQISNKWLDRTSPLKYIKSYFYNSVYFCISKINKLLYIYVIIMCDSQTTVTSPYPNLH